MKARDTETYAFVTDLLDHYVDNAPKPRFYGGSNIPELENAKQKTQEALQQSFGMPVPLAFSHRRYTHSWDDEHEVAGFVKRFFANTSPDDPRSIDGLATEAAQIRLRTYKGVMDIEKIKPTMTITESLTTVGSLLDSFNRKRMLGSSEFHSSMTDCVVTVFGMNAVHLVQDEASPGEQFDSESAALAIKERVSEDKKFDLPWLLGTLGTEHAQNKTGHVVRVRGTLGLDFGEIEEQVIKPLRSRAPGWKFILNTLLASDEISTANHAVTVIQASDEVVTVQDPRHGTVDMLVKEFWDRWTPTNMQAAITIAKPVAA